MDLVSKILKVWHVSQIHMLKKTKQKQKTQQTNAHVQKIGKTAHADRFGMQIIVK